MLGVNSYFFPLTTPTLPSTSWPSLNLVLKNSLSHKCEPLTQAIPSSFLTDSSGIHKTHIDPSKSKYDIS